MANMCMNTLIFAGEDNQVEAVMELFEAMIAEEQKTGNGQNPYFITEATNWFFSLSIWDGVISYESRWAPNIEEVLAIAKWFNVRFILDYDESGNCIFGKAIYNIGDSEVTTYELEQADFDRYEYDDDTDSYILDGDKSSLWESEGELQDYLLEQKMKPTTTV